MNKYKLLTEDTITVGDRCLYRIQALHDFGIVKEGELGGYIEKEENLSHEGNCWVFKNAWIFGNAQVFDDAWVFENAEVYDNAQVFENAKVSGNAVVYGNAKVFENAQVCDKAMVSGDAQVFGNAQVGGNAKVYGYAIVCGNAQVGGNACVFGFARVFSNALIAGCATVSKDPIVITGLSYVITKTDKHIQVGCKLHSFEEWRDIIDTDRYRDELKCEKEYNRLKECIHLLVSTSFDLL